MARVECTLCGGKADTTKGNYIYINESHQHKTCPKKPILSDDEKKDLDELKLAIKWLTDKQGVPLSPAQWRMVTAQIKQLKDDGYSYKEQLKAFKWYFDKGNKYLGYGIISFVIEQALREDYYVAEEKTNEQILKEKMEQRRRERVGE